MPKKPAPVPVVEAPPGLLAWRMAAIALALLGLVFWLLTSRAPANAEVREVGGRFAVLLIQFGLWLSVGSWMAPRRRGWWIMALTFVALVVGIALNLPALFRTPMGVLIILFCVPAAIWSVVQARKSPLA